MKVRHLRRQRLKLMNYAPWGERRLMMRYYGGRKWTRRQRERMAEKAGTPMMFNRIVSDADYERAATMIEAIDQMSKPFFIEVLPLDS